MLPKDLLLVKRKQGNIKPKYLRNTLLASKVINTFKDMKGKNYNQLKKELKKLEQGRKEYKKVRGLSELLERKCTFVSPTPLDCIEVRRFLFSHGFVTSDKERERKLTKASHYFEAPKKEIEKAIFGDLYSEQILQEINLVKPKKLTAEFNLSQIQTLLFNALELTITIDDYFQQIFRKINYLGLMYQVSDDKITITGPASLFKKTRKYGTKMAKIVPIILSSNKWSIDAEIEMKYGNNSRIYHFKLNSSNDILLPKIEAQVKPFDSEVEAKFYHDFKLFAPDWEIEREPTFIKAGNYVTIPDFGFYKWGIRLYLEVVGFWTPEYLEKKISKLNKTDTEILVAVNKKLKCTKQDFPGDVIFYKNNIPIKPILKILREKEEECISDKLTQIQNISINEDIVLVERKAKELGVSPSILTKKEFSEHFIIGDKIVSQNFLNRLKNEIGNKRHYSNIKKILEKYDVTHKVLEYIGFKVLWNGLLPEKIAPIK